VEKPRSRKDYILLTLKGMAMGAADIVPGVSGGTVALITGVYAELLSSLKGLTPAKLLILKSEGISAFWNSINGWFLLALFGGVLLSLKTLAALVGYCLANYPLFVWAFFTGLILGSSILLLKHQKLWGWRQIVALLIGAALVLALGFVKPMSVDGGPVVLFLGGFIAICAMILPGISGSFILLVLGLYSVFLRALQDLDLLALASFGLGCISGLLLFSRVLSWLLERFYSTTLATMIGFLVGSLYTTWPWKQVLETMVDRHGELVPTYQQSVLPSTYEIVNNTPAQVLLVLLCAAGGLFLVLLVEYTGKKTQ
jgi:putative membrane protein